MTQAHRDLGIPANEVRFAPTSLLRYILEMHAIANLRNFNEVDIHNANLIRAELTRRNAKSIH